MFIRTNNAQKCGFLNLELTRKELYTQVVWVYKRERKTMRGY
jgi:hypothetical protein